MTARSIYKGHEIEYINDKWCYKNTNINIDEMIIGFIYRCIKNISNYFNLNK